MLGTGGDTPARAVERSASILPNGEAAAITAELAGQGALDAFYRARNYRSIWTPHDAALLIGMLEEARADGLDPARYDLPGLRALAADPNRAGAREVALSRALVAYVRDLHGPSRSVPMVYVDEVLAPDTRPDRILTAAASAPSLPLYLAEIRRMHPLYEELRAALAAYSSSSANPTGLAGPVYARRLMANMDRLRGLPAGRTGRYVLVDAASARLWMYEDGQIADTMRVVVGKPSEPTPMMAGLIRFAVRRPYWNVPPDLAQARAAKVLAKGEAALAREKLEILSDWGDSPRRLDPAKVNWRAVVQGRQELRMRQVPGPWNMMGAVKFMLPNQLGIYLHDTPRKADFARADRMLSSGCVRVEDAERLARWLFEGQEPRAMGTAEERIDLPAPVPVYILYLTATPGAGRNIVLQADRYGRDAMLPSQLAEPRSLDVLPSAQPAS